jgi:hypothetical protein
MLAKSPAGPSGAFSRIRTTVGRLEPLTSVNFPLLDQLVPAVGQAAVAGSTAGDAPDNQP